MNPMASADDTVVEQPDIGMTDAAVDRMRSDPFLRFDPSGVRLNAYYRWLHGMPGGAVAHWLAAEREEVFRQARDHLVFPSTGQNGFSSEPFYNHFKLLTFWRCGQSESKLILGPESPRVCSICGLSEPAVSFRDDAHVIPEMFGCRDLLTNEECDRCNGESGRNWDNELGVLTLADRAFAGVRAKGGRVPKLKDGESYVGGGNLLGSTSVALVDQQIFRITGPGSGELTLQQPAARPAQAAKAIAKMAWLMLDSRARAKHLGIRSWLQNENEKLEIQLTHIWTAMRFKTIAAIWERVDDDDGLAELIVMLAFGHAVLLWAPPNWQNFQPRELIVPPLPKAAYGARHFTARQQTATGQQRTGVSIRTVAFTFAERRRVHLTAPVEVEMRVGGDGASGVLRTYAISSPGADASRPHFVLSGGELVGSVVLEDTTGASTWTWSYKAIASEGDLTATLEVLRATFEGGPVDVTVVGDGASLLKGATFAATEEQGYYVRQLARMAYYIGVLNRRLGTLIELGDFSDDDLDLARWLASGLLYGRYTEDSPDEDVLVGLQLDAVEGLAADMGEKVATLTFSSDADTRYEILGQLVSVGATKKILVAARVASPWNALLETARRDGRALVPFRCESIAYVFESVVERSGNSEVDTR
jgi:hypothetical protein